MKKNVKVASWVVAGLLPATALVLAFVAVVESISTAEPHFIPTTIFQHPGTPGPSHHLVKAALYIVVLAVLVVAAVGLPLRYGVAIAATIFGVSTFVTTASIRGLVGGWVLLPAWLLLALGTVMSSVLLWLKLVDFHRSRRERPTTN